MNFFDGTKIEEQRVLLAVYPILYVESYLSVTTGFSHPSFQAILLHTSLDDTYTVIGIDQFAS